MRKILLVKLGAIGDVAMVLPAAWELYRSGAAIDWVCGRSVAPLLSCYPWIRPIVANDAMLLGGRRFSAIREMMRMWRILSGKSYDLCAVLQYDRKYQLLTLPVRARRSISLRRGKRELQLISERHHSAEYKRILCDLPDGYNSQDSVPVAPDILPPNPLPRRKKIRIALVPGGARNQLRDDPLRRWPVDAYVALAAMLLERGYEVVLSGGPDDAWVAPQFAGQPVDNRIGQWKIPETLAFYQSCDCVVTHDTGPLHLAGLMQCSLVGLFGPTAPSKFLPRRKRVVGIWGGERLPCRPCYDGNGYANCQWNGCMISIPPQRVFAAVEWLLANPEEEWRVENL